MPHFSRFIGIDYSGAQSPDASLTGLRIYVASAEQDPLEILPTSGTRKYWTRRGLAEWLVAELCDGPPALVGIDHGFSFPQNYFEEHDLKHDWPEFLEDFQKHWPTNRDGVFVDHVRNGLIGVGAARSGSSRWRRITEERCRAKSVFHFDVQGSVAKSTHAGIPWLPFLRKQLGARVHFWPFDGWTPPVDRSVIAEVYPALWSRVFPNEGRNSHQHDAYSVARWMQQSDHSGKLTRLFEPELDPEERKQAEFEGWILGLV